MLKKREKRYRRHKRIRLKVMGNAKIPRLCVFRSSKHIYAQLIDDDKGRTLVSTKGQVKISKAREVGKLLAEKAREKKIEKVLFDRGGYKYHGRVKALAEGAREGGLQF